MKLGRPPRRHCTAASPPRPHIALARCGGARARRDIARRTAGKSQSCLIYSRCVPQLVPSLAAPRHMPIPTAEGERSVHARSRRAGPPRACDQRFNAIAVSPCCAGHGGPETRRPPPPRGRDVLPTHGAACLWSRPRPAPPPPNCDLLQRCAMAEGGAGRGGSLRRPPAPAVPAAPALTPPSSPPPRLPRPAGGGAARGPRRPHASSHQGGADRGARARGS
jgi:hypothetical protein